MEVKTTGYYIHLKLSLQHLTVLKMLVFQIVLILVFTIRCVLYCVLYCVHFDILDESFRRHLPSISEEDNVEQAVHVFRRVKSVIFFTGNGMVTVRYNFPFE